MKPPECSGCELETIGGRFTNIDGLGSSGVLILAEAPGEREDQDGLPLRPNAPAGSVFQGIIRRISGLDRSQLTISNVVRCRPPKNWLDGAPYELSAIEQCQIHAAKTIRDRRPRAIVTLGSVPTRTLTGMSGYNQGIKLVRGWILNANRPEYFVDGQPIPVIPTYHPSFLLRASKTRSKDKDTAGGKVEKAEGGMSLSGVVRRDIELALEIAKMGRPAPREFQTIVGTREVMDALIHEARLHPERAIAWDIETPRSLDKADDESEIDSIQAQVTQIQFALDDKRGFVFPGFSESWVVAGTRRLLGLPNRKYTWNGWKFDNKVVSGHHGIPIRGEDVDLMSAWAWIQPDLPKGLQFATSFYAPELGPWKHLAFSDEDLYGCKDVISLHINAQGIFKVMDERGLRTSYDRHCLMLRTEMVEASHRGFPVDEERHRKFGEKIYAEIEKVDGEIKGLVPESILNFSPKSGYVRTPKQLLPAIPTEGVPPVRIVLTESVELEDDEDKPTGQFVESKVVYAQRKFPVLNKESLEFDNVVRWVKIIPFKFGSGPQKIAYIKHRRDEEIKRRVEKGQKLADAERLAKYKVPKVKNKQKELKDNTGGKELEKLFKETGDPVFEKLVAIGKLKKLHGTYVKGWTIKDGAVHTTFGVADTATGQLTSTNPGVQNLPKHSALAKEFRFCIAAKPGKVLLEFDKKAFHAQTLAFEAKDKDYARFSAIDIHSFTTAHRLRLPEAGSLVKWSNSDLKAFFKLKKSEPFIYKSEGCVAYPEGMTFQQVRDFKSKRVMLGIGFAQGPASIYDQNPEGYKSKKEVQEFLDVVKATFPRVFKFQKEITQLAHKQTYLISKFGYIRRFHDVYQWDNKIWDSFSSSWGGWRPGDDYEAAVAFLPANDAFGMIKEEMLRMGGWAGWPKKEKVGGDLLEKYGFCNQLHDAVFFHCDQGRKDKCIEDVVRIMREPCPTLSDPEMAPEGLFVDVSCQVGEDWANMKEIDI